METLVFLDGQFRGEWVAMDDHLAAVEQARREALLEAAEMADYVPEHLTRAQVWSMGQDEICESIAERIRAEANRQPGSAPGSSEPREESTEGGE